MAPIQARSSPFGFRSTVNRRCPIDTRKPPKKLKLLFADDERSLQSLIGDELTRLGHEVTVCPDGATAVAAIEMNTYDCIIVDLDMPKLSGIEVIRSLRAEGKDYVVKDGDVLNFLFNV